MAKAQDTQTRGHCQFCGNQQAVVAGGRMSKHGYTVEHGWFNGVCPGQHHAPMEVSREKTDEVVAEVRKECATLRENVEKLRRGSLKPMKCRSGQRIQVEDPTRPGRKSWEYEYIAFKDGEEYYQREAVDEAIRNAEYRAGQGERFAAYLEKVADDYHGKELVIIEKKQPAARIHTGDKKMASDGVRVFTAKYQDGARVYFMYPSGDKMRESWMGTQAWRKLADVAK